MTGRRLRMAALVECRAIVAHRAASNCRRRNSISI